MKFLHAVAQRIRAKMKPPSFRKPLAEAPVVLDEVIDPSYTTRRRRRRRVKIIGFLRLTHFEGWRRKKVRRRISQASRRRNRHG